MAKNFFMTFFNSHKDKNSIPKNTNLKLSPNDKLSNLVLAGKISNESNILQQKQQTMDNMLLSFYSKLDNNNNKINNFIEKIKKLNKKFYTSCEKYISIKTSYDKLSDDLFLNLFQQIDCYAVEIQRLNDKIKSIDNKENKNIIKTLTKELSDNKEKIRNYELKLKEKAIKEDKLLKELESYKRRIIFFKTKVNINLNARNADRKPKIDRYDKYSQDKTNPTIKKMNTKNDYMRRYTQRIKKNNKLRIFSPSPKSNKNESFISSNYQSNKEQPKVKKIDNNYLNNNRLNSLSNWKKNINKDFEKNILNKDKDSHDRGIFSDGEADKKNNNKPFIKILRKNKIKESIIIPKNYNKDDDINSSIKIDSINIDKNVNIEENKKSPEKNIYFSGTIKNLDNSFEKLDDSQNSIFNDYDNNKNKKKENNRNEKINKNFNSTKDIKNNSKTEKKIKNSTIIPSLYNNTTIKKNKFKPSTNKKIFQTKKIFNIPSKKFMKSNLKKSSKMINRINNDILNNNTMDYINNDNNNDTFESLKNSNTIDNIKDNLEQKKSNTIDVNNNNISEKTDLKMLESKTVKFKENCTSEKEQKLYFTTSESENNDNNVDSSSKEISINLFANKRNTSNKISIKTESNHSGNISDAFSKGNLTNGNLSSGSINIAKDNNNNKNENKKKNNLNSKPKKDFNKTMNNFNKKPKINKTKINISNNNKKKKEQNNKEKEASKMLKEMYEDNNNNIDMLTTQEEQIKFLLNLIDLDDS